MSSILKIVLALFWLMGIPALLGMIFAGYTKTWFSLKQLIWGFLCSFSIAEVLTLLCIFFKTSLNLLCFFYAACSLIGIAAAFIVNRKRKGAERIAPVFGIHRLSIWLLLACILIVLQVFFLAYFAHFDADDSFYIGQATADIYSNTIFSINPYTGMAYNGLPSRYILSPFPVYLAIISRLSLNLHPAAIAHILYPVVFIPLFYIVHFFLGKKLIANTDLSDKDRHYDHIFLFLLAFMICFCGYSVYNSGTFLITRIWHGKAVLCSVLIPFLLSCFLSDEEKTKFFYLIVLLSEVSSCLLSSMGIFLAPIVIGSFALIGFVQNRKVSLFIKTVACAAPSAILGAIFLML